MSKFQPIILEYKGRKYIIPANQVMGAILVIEDYVTLAQLFQWQESGIAPLGKIASAYAAVLRYAGAEVSSEEMYEAMFSKDAAENSSLAVRHILSLMLPPSGLNVGGAATATKGKGSDQKKARSSKKHTSPV